MNKIIEITIRNKVARIASSPIIVGKNKDYIVRFDFDEDWDKYDTKTARFSQDDEYQDIIFAGNECSMPALDGGKVVEVGVYAGDISTTTPAYLKVQKSIIDDDGVPAEPQPDVYAQLMERLNELEAPAAVLYTGQELTEAQKAQARENIGVAQSDWEQTDETAADYLKNRPFGNVAYDGIFFKRVPGGYNLVRVPGFNALANIQGSRQAEIRRGGNVVNTGSASVSVSDLDGSISIKYNSTAGTIIEFKGSNGYLSEINVQSNTDITSVSEYTLHIDGLYYEEYIKLSADSVEGTLPSASAADCALISTGSGNNWSVTKISTDFPLASATGRGAVKVGDGLSISSDGKLSVDMSGLDTKSLGISGASVGQTVKIKTVDSSGVPTKWEPADMPSGGGGTDTSLGLTGATVGQTVKIKAVDENGVPTEWEAADAASGENWEFINEISTNEWISSVTINQDSNGNPFSLKKMRIFMTLPKTTNEAGEEPSDSGYAYYAVNDRRPAWQNPSYGWNKALFLWTIEAMGDYYTVTCFKDGAKGAELWHSDIFKSEGAFSTITKFEWRMFNAAIGWSRTNFKVYGVKA